MYGKLGVLPACDVLTEHDNGILAFVGGGGKHNDVLCSVVVLIVGLIISILISAPVR